MAGMDPTQVDPPGGDEGAPPGPSDESGTLVDGVGMTPQGPDPTCVRRIGPYRILKELGRGGMGVVYWALDPRMNRTVALKTLLYASTLDTTHLERFHREVETAAKLKHPGIVTIYEVGMAREVSAEGAVQSAPYFAMEYIAGESLNRTVSSGRPLPGRVAARIAREVATALAHAHSRGIVHRDLKPHNIMVEPAASSPDSAPTVITDVPLGCQEPALTLSTGRVVRSYRVILTDFGLARDLTSETRLTVDGHVLGTPMYMPPEQAAGEMDRVDARSDVYSLGAVFYELLTGRAPFRGQTHLEVLCDVLRGEPTRPSKLAPGLHRDLETICMKAMEKDPARRYPSAELMAADLGRFLRGDAIEARPIGAAARIRRKLARNWVASLLGGVLAVSLGALTVTRVLDWRAARAASREREELLRGYVEELERSGRAVVDAALARRAMGDLAGCAAYVAGLRIPVERLKAERPEMASPWYHEGRMLRVLGREREAEAIQETAVTLARASGDMGVLPLALYERGILRVQRLLREWNRACEEMLWIRSADESGPPGADQPLAAEEVAAAYPSLVVLRRQVLDDLGEAERLLATRGDAALSERHRRARALVARGLHALLNSEEGAGQLEEALTLDPYVQEALVALAEAAVKIGDYAKAVDLFGRGTRADRGYLPYWTGLGRASWEASHREEKEGRDGASLRNRAVAALSEAVRLDDKDAEAHRLLGEIYALTGRARTKEGADPSEDFARALEELDAALRLDPGSGSILCDRALLWRALGVQKSNQGRDPSQEFEQSLADCKEAHARGIRDESALFSEAMVHVAVGEAKRMRYEDPIPEYQQAISLFQRLERVNPSLSSVWVNEAIAWLLVASVRAQRGEDGEADCRLALTCCEHALAINPHLVAATRETATAWAKIAEVRWRRGEDGSAEADRALATYEKALSLRATDSASLRGRAEVLLARANAIRFRGGDSASEFRRAIEQFDRALAVSPSSFEAHVGRADALGGLGDSLPPGCAEAVDAYRRAVEEDDRAMAIRPGDSDVAFNRLVALLHVAQATQGTGGDASESLDEVLEEVRAGVAAHPLSPAWMGLEADVHAAMGMRTLRLGKDPTEELMRAISGYDRVLSANAPSATTAMNRGWIRRTLGDVLMAKGRDPSDEYCLAVQSYELALRVRPDIVHAMCELGFLQWALGQLKGVGEDSLADLQAALAWYDRALEKQPRVAKAMAGRADVLSSIADVQQAQGEDDSAVREEALKAYDQSIEWEAGHWQWHFGRAHALGRLGRHRDAVSEWERVLAMPGCAVEEARAGLARARAEAERTERGPR